MSDDLKIEIPQALFAAAESACFDGVYAPESLHNGPDEYTFTKPFVYHVEIENVGDAFALSGTIVGDVVTACGRCLEDVVLHLESPLDGYFLINEQGHEVSEEEAQEFDVLSEDHIIDLEPLLHAALLLDLPLVALCDENCAGLCPQCGVNRNIKRCTCEKDAEQARIDEKNAENPFAVLRNLDFNE